MSDKLRGKEWRQMADALKSVRRIHPDREQARQAVAKALAAIGREPPGKPANLSVVKWLRRPTRLAAAAVLLAVLLTGVLGLLSGRAAAGATFAEVMRKVRQATTVRYDVKIWERDRFIGTIHESLAPGRFRQDYEDKIAIYDYAAGKLLICTKGEELIATLHVIGDGTQQNEIRVITELPESAGKDLGFEELSGARAQVFEAAQNNQVTRLWVDPGTGLPLKVRVTTPAPASDPNIPQVVLVIENFEWNCAFPDSQFSLELPKGYLWASQRALSTTEQDLLAMLEPWAELNGQRFPDGVDQAALSRFAFKDLEEAGKVHDFAVGKYGQMLLVPEGRWKDLIRTARVGRLFVMKMQEADWCYQGGGVELGDANTAICWWRQMEGPRYRVVYGDLSVKTVTPADLPARRVPALSAPATTPSH